MGAQLSYAQWLLEPYCIGMKLRSLRTKKRLTLSRLGAETGLSTALLSKLETQRMIPTLPTLATICRVYGVGLSYFFCEPSHHTLSITRKAHLEGDGRTPDPNKCIPLNAPSEKPKLNAEMIELTDAPFVPEDGGPDICTFLYVYEGKMQLDADGMKQVLDAGDCAYMETQMPTNWCAMGNDRCRVLVIKPARANA